VSKRLKILLAVLGVVVLCAGVYYCLRLFGGGAEASPEELARQALNGATTADKVEAAVRLGDCGPEAVDELRRVLQDSNVPGVRAACIEGLGRNEDYESVDAMLGLLEDESVTVRSTAGAVASNLIPGPKVDPPFKADGPEAERKKAIEELKSNWEEYRDSPLLNRHKRELQKGQENEDS
jgi:hypothetical protein